MNFTTIITDMDGHEYTFKAQILGRGMYDDNGEKSGMVIEGFEMVDIEISRRDTKIMASDINHMPDRFSEREIRNMKREATDAFLQDWMSVQDLASDASYENFISQGLQK